jgi:hypothetical protein
MGVVVYVNGQQVTIPGNGAALEANRLAIHATESTPQARNNMPAAILHGSLPGSGIGVPISGVAKVQSALIAETPGAATLFGNGTLIQTG